MVIGLVVNSSHATTTLYVLHLVTQKNLRHTYQLQKIYDTQFIQKMSTCLNSFKTFYDTPFIQKMSTCLNSFKTFYDTPFIQKMSTCLRTHLSRRRQYRYMFRHKTFLINWHIWQCLLLNNVHIHVRITVMISSSRLSHRVCQNNRIT